MNYKHTSSSILLLVMFSLMTGLAYADKKDYREDNKGQAKSYKKEYKTEHYEKEYKKGSRSHDDYREYKKGSRSYDDHREYKKGAKSKHYEKETRRDTLKPYYKEYKRDPSRYRKDHRHHHDHYYPRTGVKIKVLPSHYHRIHYHNHHYYYSSGIWYRSSAGIYVVVRPPIGIIIPVLPAFYTTIWYHGVPYYYANDVYYVWRPDLDGYVVTEPPEDIVQEKAVPMSDRLYAYPMKGQSEQQQADDRYACHRWAVKQTGYDPSALPTDKTTAELNDLRQGYQKAMTACLTGKGYSVR